MFYFLYRKMRDGMSAIGRTIWSICLSTEARAVLTGYIVLLLLALIPIVNIVVAFLTTAFVCMFIWEDVSNKCITRDINGNKVFNMEMYNDALRATRFTILLYYPLMVISAVTIAYYSDIKVYKMWPVVAICAGLVTASAVGDAIRLMAVRYKFEREN